MPKRYKGLSVTAQLREQFIRYLLIKPSEIYFYLQIGIFFKLGKKEDILDWEWGLISDSGDREKRPSSFIHILGSIYIDVVNNSDFD